MIQLWKPGFCFVSLEWKFAGRNFSIVYLIPVQVEAVSFFSEECQNLQLKVSS